MKWLILGHQGASARVVGVGREGTGQTSDPLPFPTELRSSPSLGSCQLSSYLSVLSPPPGAQEAKSDCLLRSAILWTLLTLLCLNPGIFRCLWPDRREAFLKCGEGPLRLPLDEELLTVKKMDAQRAAFSFTKCVEWEYLEKSHLLLPSRWNQLQKNPGHQESSRHSGTRMLLGTHPRTTESLNSWGSPNPNRS